MLKRIIKNKKAQQTAEYALLISLVVAAVIAMQTYAQRTLQARIRAASTYLTDQTSTLGDDTNQYEPYYLDTSYTVATASTESELQNQRADETARYAYNVDNTRTRSTGGYTKNSYDPLDGLLTGI
jgi:Tfp pilus assembly protein PilE